MESTTFPHPEIVSRDASIAERKELLAAEKELTKHLDRVRYTNQDEPRTRY